MRKKDVNDYNEVVMKDNNQETKISSIGTSILLIIGQV